MTVGACGVAKIFLVNLETTFGLGTLVKWTSILFARGFRWPRRTRVLSDPRSHTILDPARVLTVDGWESSGRVC